MERRIACILTTVTFLLGGCAGTSKLVTESNQTPVELTIFHNNDGESQLINAGTGLEDFGGIARFSQKLKELVAELPSETQHLVLSSGDNILPGPELRVSMDKGPPFLDAVAINNLKYNALCFGNHDFDLGPDFLADFVSSTNESVTFLAANLDFSREPKLKSLWKKGRIAGHKIVELSNGSKIGIIGIITPRLPNISAPRKVKTSGRLAYIVQSEVHALEAKGVNKIVLLSHLQDISIEVELIKEIEGVDVVIGGGGDELLSNKETLLVPGDEKANRGPYPLMVNSKDGRRIPIVTTAGSFRYIGKLVLKFSADGHIQSVDKSSGVFRVASQKFPDGVAEDPVMIKQVLQPLKQGLTKIAKTELAKSKVSLEGRRSKVRGQETNLGNLVADAFLWYGQRHAADHDLPNPDVGLVNGGAIRNDSIIPIGTLSELDAQKIVPLPGFVSLVSNVPVRRLKEVMEYSIKNIGGGAFLQISGMKVEYDVSRSSDRVRNISLDDGTVLVKDGKIIEEEKSLSIATLSFLAKGGGKIPLKGLDSSNFAANYKKALVDYLKHLKSITPKQYRAASKRLIPVSKK